MVPDTGIWFLWSDNYTLSSTSVRLVHFEAVASGQYWTTITPAYFFMPELFIVKYINNFWSKGSLQHHRESDTICFLSLQSCDLGVVQSSFKWRGKHLSVMAFSSSQCIYKLQSKTLLQDKHVFKSLKPEEGTNFSISGRMANPLGQTCPEKAASAPEPCAICVMLHAAGCWITLLKVFSAGIPGV